MNELRKGFYVFDMAVFGFFVFALNHTMIFESTLVEITLKIALLLRLCVSVLLYKQERLTVFPLLAFVLLYGVAVYNDAFHEYIINMAKFPEAVMGTQAIEYPDVIVRPIEFEMLMRGIVYWVWLIPLAVYVIQFAAKQTIDNGYPWYYLLGIVVIKDRIGKMLLSMIVPLFIAFLIGYVMDEYLSFYTLMSLPPVGYYFWNRHVGSKPYWVEYILLLVGLYVFDQAQYKIDTERITYLVASAVVILSVCGWMLYRSRNLVVSTLAFLLSAVLLPTVSLGYNVYHSIEGARSISYPDVGFTSNRGYMYIKRTETINGEDVNLMGVRDRYCTTIPCEYMFVVPTKLYSPFANCVKYANGKRDTIVRSVEYGYKLE